VKVPPGVMVESVDVVEEASKVDKQWYDASFYHTIPFKAVYIAERGRNKGEN